MDDDILAIAGIIGLVIGIGVAVWFAYFFFVTPMVMNLFNLDVDPVQATWFIFIFGDAGIIGLAIGGKKVKS